MALNHRHQKTLKDLFREPTLGNIHFTDIEALMIALGGVIREGSGSRIKIVVENEQWRCHRPHPGKEARRYQVEEAREFLRRIGLNHEHFDL